ncbi:MAG TPA: hypothetical protein VNN80_31625, partial [Polyangiaceae bacterium]|nr:hypothetical protein [Polyangiaceae bacterium]
LIVTLACRASVQADAKVSADANGAEATGETDADAELNHDTDAELKSFDRPLEAPASAPEPPADDATGAAHALLGARHDLAYAGPKTPSCACLAVALSDQPTDSAFSWELEQPRLEPASQWIIALSSSDVPCEAAPGGTLGASYQGYVLDGNDVVVYVEALGEGRPMTNGAIIPRPKPSGAVFVEPTNAIYGRSLEGKNKRCKIAAPGESKG